MGTMGVIAFIMIVLVIVYGYNGDDPE